MKIITLGKGFISDHLPYSKIESRVELNLDKIVDLLDTYTPDVLVNCIGRTGLPNIDWCQSHIEETTSINIGLPILLAEACAIRDVHLIQIGSGCIFYGESFNKVNGIDLGWKETDLTCPKSYYSRTKFACDLAIGEMEHVTTLRIRMPISTHNNPRNLINKLKNYKQIIDIPNSVTFMNDLVRCVDWVAKNSKIGIYHVTNPEPLTAVQIMTEYQKYVPIHTFDKITEEELDKLVVAKRSNCILNTDKLTKAGFKMTASKEALEKCMEAYSKNI